MRQALIPAAGTGSRLGRLTENKPKCMIEVNGETLISRCLRQLDDLDLDRIVIVTGHANETLMTHVTELGINTEIVFIHNSDYQNSNNIISVHKALTDLEVYDTLLIESDLIFDKEILSKILEENISQVVLSRYQPHMDGTLIELEKNKMIFGSTKLSKKRNNLFKTVNIYYFTKEFIDKIFIPLLRIYINQNRTDSYYETPLKLVSEINLGALKPLVVEHDWFEIDDVNDLDIATNIFCDDRLADTHSRYGGFWRFEEKKDFTYLSNPFFPNDEFFVDIEESLRSLIHHYPSTQWLNARLMAAVLDVDERFVTVGNGASEIIKIVSERYHTQTIISPTFKEYENRCKSFTTVESLNEISSLDTQCVILVNPNNPTGKIFSNLEVREQLERNPDIMFIVDESFMDFAEQNESLLNDATIQKYKNLLIIKSIGKTHGVGGLRLGALVGQTATDFAHQTPIWNINSLAEFFLQRFKKYEKAYLKSLDMIRFERKSMEAKLSNILNINIVPSEGNFVYIELERELARDLQSYLFDQGYIVKVIEISNDQSAMRLAVRNGLDNHLICAAIERYTGDTK